MSLLSDLESALSVPRVESSSKAPKDFEPGVVYVSGRPDVITTPDTSELTTTKEYEAIVASMGVPLPAGAQLVLEKAWFNTAAWTRDDKDQERAVTKPVWRYAFKVVYDIALLPDPDYEALAKSARRKTRSTASFQRADKATQDRTMVVTLADLQIGKVDVYGGTAALLERLEVCLEKTKRRIRSVKPFELILLDVGDILEGFESAPNADRTNDLSQTQQIRLARRILWTWIEALAPLVATMVVAGVPSNHCRVRRGKQTLGDPLDDYGIENIVACSELAAMNEVAYGHVAFAVPKDHSESLAIDLVGGKVLGAFHGHQKNRPEQFEDYFKGQALGRTPVGQADILVGGHFHQLRVQTVGDDRWLFIAPTLDSGSSWYTNTTGSASRDGVLSFVVDSAGWWGLDVAWADAVGF